MIFDRLCDLFLLHRGLDPNDEDSTVEEQAEKLLYIFSKDAGDTNERVQLITTVEALMELSKSFMGKPLETTIMNNKMWIFYECEPNIWLILSMRNDHTVAVETGESLELMSAYGCRLFLHRLYSLLHCMIGSLQSYLIGQDGLGWDCIQRMITARKNVRKTQMKLSNAENDLEKLHDDQRQGIERETMADLLQQSHALIEELGAKLADAKAELSVELSSLSYHLPSLKDKLSAFMVWYLSIEDINNVSCLTSTFDVMDGKLRTRAIAGTIHRILRHIQQAIPVLTMNCVVTFENRVLWSDVDQHTTTTLVDFLLRWDSSFLLSQPNLTLRKAMQDFAKSMFYEQKCDYNSLDSNQKAKLVESVRELDERKRQRIGVMTQRGQYISFDKYSVRLPSIQRISELRSQHIYSVPENEQSPPSSSNTTANSNGSSSSISKNNSSNNSSRVFCWPKISTKETISNTSSSSTRKRLAQGLTFFESLDMGDGNAIVCNPIHAATAHTNGDSNSTQGLGRALFLFFGRLVVTVIIPQAELENLYNQEFKALIWSYTSASLHASTPPPPPPPVSSSENDDTSTTTNSTKNVSNNTNDNQQQEDQEGRAKTETDKATSTSTTSSTNTTTGNNVSAPPAVLDDAFAASTIPALQINSIRMSRLTDKVDKIVQEASYPRMSHFHDYDGLQLLQLDIAKLKVMYIARKLRDAIIGDVQSLETYASNNDHTNALFSASTSTNNSNSSSNMRRSNISPVRSSSILINNNLTATSNGSNNGSIGGNSTIMAPLLRRDSTSSSAAGNAANNTNNNNNNNNNGNGNASSNSANNNSVYVQQQQALWLLHRASPGTLRGLLQPRINLAYSNNNSNNNNNSGSGNSAQSGAAGAGNALMDKETMRVICVSSTYCAVKLFGMDADNVIYSLIQPDYGITATSNSNNDNAILDRYFLSLPRYSESSLLLIQCIVTHFGFPVVRAIHDIWSRLNTSPNSSAGSSGSSGSSGVSSQSSSNSNNSSSSSNHNVIATRISTPQRGGIWVVGTRILNNKPMLLVVNHCATFDEVMEVFDLLAQEASSG